MKRKLLLPSLLLLTKLTGLHAAPLPATVGKVNVDEIIVKAQNSRLARDEYWLKLLHADRAWFGRHTTRADVKTFFLTEKSVKDLEGELTANIRALFIPIAEQGNTGYLCRFPARSKFLADRLSLPAEMLRFDHCTGYQKFFREHEIEQVSIVYAAANLSEPASMFGHSFFKIKTTTGKEFSLGFGARVTDNFFLSYVFKGFTGGFYGTFQVADYALAIKEYPFGENRNLWEFTLKFDNVQRERFLDHLWEMNSTAFRYYFMDENCSYYVPYFLEVADPKLKFNFRNKWFLVPSGIMRDLMNNWDSVDQIFFYPSYMNNYMWASDTLSRSELKAAFRLANGVVTPEFRNSPKKQIIASAAQSIILLENKASKTELNERGKDLMKKLEANVAASGTTLGNLAEPDVSNPVLGHAFGMAAAGGGQDLNGGFISLQFRPLVHDLTDSPLGYLYGSELQAMNTDLRYYPETGTVHLNRLDLFEIKSIKPVIRPQFSLSWMASLGARDIARELGTAKVNQVAANVEYRVGPAFQLPLPGEYSALYTMAAFRGYANNTLEYSIHVPVGGATGLLYNPVDTITLHTEFSWLYDAIQPQQTLSRVSTAANLFLSANFALQAEYTYFLAPVKNQEFRGAIKIYF